MNNPIKKNLLVLAIFVIIFVAFMIFEMITTYKAHETFDGYCKWRGLVVESKSNDYGYCKNPQNNKEFKIVLFKNRWYLDGDLPCGFLCF